MISLGKPLLKSSSIRSVVLTQNRLVCDRHWPAQTKLVTFLDGLLSIGLDFIINLS